MNSTTIHKCLGEGGTFWLTSAGCSSAVTAATFPEVGIGLRGVPLASRLIALAMADPIGHLSGCPIGVRCIRAKGENHDFRQH